jgi:hypothetical protein
MWRLKGKDMQLIIKGSAWTLVFAVVLSHLFSILSHLSLVSLFHAFASAPKAWLKPSLFCWLITLGFLVDWNSLQATALISKVHFGFDCFEPTSDKNLTLE